MKKTLRLTGLMMSALLCLFTSCSSDDDDDDDKGLTGMTAVEVDVLTSAETLLWTDGAFVVTFSPSGMTAEIRANEVSFATEADPEKDAALLTAFSSKKVMKATCKTMCDRNDTKIVVAPSLSIKQGTVLTDDVKYDYEVTGVIRYGNTPESVRRTSNYVGNTGIKGSTLNNYLQNRSIPIVSLEIK